MKEVNDNNFAELVTANSRPSVVDFWAPWCGPCRAISPIIEELAAEYEGKVDIYKCNVDENSDVVVENGVRNIPTIIFVKNGAVVDKLVGAAAKSALVEKIENLLIKYLRLDCQPKERKMQFVKNSCLKACSALVGEIIDV